MDRARPALMLPWRKAHPSSPDGHRYIFVALRGGGPFGGTPEGDEDDIKKREERAACAIGTHFTNWRHETLRLHGYHVAPGSRGHHGPHAERTRAASVLDPGQHEWRATLLLGHTLKSTVGRAYTASLAGTNAETLRIILRERPWDRTSHREPTATTDGARRSRREQREAVEQNAALLSEVQALLGGLDDLSAREAMTVLRALSERYSPAKD